MKNQILTIDNKEEEKFLRKKTAEFDFKKNNKKDTLSLLLDMKKIMQKADGVGLSANQIGLNLKLFVAQVPDKDGIMKFYAIFNPTIEKSSDEKNIFEEGCLSVPGKWGDVERPEKITISGFDKLGRPIKIKAWGFLARVFQHEIDHLNGKLFIDRATKIYEVQSKKEENELTKNI
jgi:peptide deformylase